MPMIWGAGSAAAPVSAPASTARIQNGQAPVRRVIASTSAMKTAASTPITSPTPRTYGSSHSEARVSGGTAKAGASPYATCVTAVADTAARITGAKPITVYSISTTSMAKATPASGVLNDAAIAAAAPHATSTRRLLFGSPMRWPATLALAAPRWIAGPSRPTDIPETIATAAPTNWTTAFLNGSRPWWYASRSRTCTTPTLRASSGSG